MNSTQLHQRIVELEGLIAEQTLKLSEKDARIAFLEEQFLLARHRHFGRSSEKHHLQGELFD